MLLEFTVRGQQIFRVDKTPLASDSRLYIAGKVTFDGEWDDITAVYLNFEPRSGEAINAYLTDGAFDESLGVSLSAGSWRVSAHGSNSAGKEIHTTTVTLNVDKAGGRDGEAPPYVPPDAAGQIAAVAAEARETANQAKELAEQSGVNADIAVKAAESAALYADRAANSAGISHNAAQNALQSENNAQQIAEQIASAEAARDQAIASLQDEISGKADKTEIPQKTSDLENDSGFLTEHQSLDGYVPKTDYSPTAKTDAMTQPVGKDANGKLWTAPTGGGSSSGSSVDIDDTLTVSGAAADAKIVGDKVGELKSDKLDKTPGTWPEWTADEQATVRKNIDAADAATVNGLKDDIDDMFAELAVSEYGGGLTADDFTWGFVNGSTGAIVGQKNRAVTKDYLPDGIVRVVCASPYMLRVSAWEKESGAFIGNWNGSGWANTSANHSAFDAFVPEYKYKICVLNPSNDVEYTDFTNAAASVMLFYSVTSGTAGDVVDALRRKTVSGTSLTISDAIAGVPMRCTCDSPVTVSGLNILPVRNVSFTGVEKLMKLGVTIPVGTYTMSMSCESTDTDSEQSLIQFGGLYIRIPHDGVRYSQKITTKTEADSINFYSGYDAAGSAGDTVFWRDLMLVRGDVNAEFEEYIEPHTWESAQDVVLSAQTNLIEADSNIGLTYIRRNEFVDSLLSATKSAELNAQTLGYVTPEMFGAVGDGVTDDAQAVQACIELAKESAIPAKMMKAYLISEGITIDSNMIVEINYLIYTGTQAAVTIVGNSSSVTINRIKSNGTGVAFISDNIMVNYNRVILGDVVCAGNCIHLHGTNRNIHQNHIEFQRLYAGGDGYNCILIVADSVEAGVAEITFIGGRCAHADWAYNGSGGNNKLMFFQVEGDIKGGYYFNGSVKALVIGDRHDESQRDGEYPYIKIVVPEISHSDEQVFGQFRFITPLGLNVNEIDVSEVCTQMPDGAYIRSNGSLGVIDCRITSHQRTGSDNPKHSQMFGERALIWANCLIFQGAPEKYWQVTGNMDLRTITEDTPAMPTVFDIACENAEIRLHPTYCFMGISRFEVIQTAEHTAKIYDYYAGNVIFDGESLGEGTFEVRTLLNGDNANLDGTNMIWMVRKIG